jgi:hypothetical protein
MLVRIHFKLHQIRLLIIVIRSLMKIYLFYLERDENEWMNKCWKQERFRIVTLCLLLSIKMKIQKSPIHGEKLIFSFNDMLKIFNYIPHFNRQNIPFEEILKNIIRGILFEQLCNIIRHWNSFNEYWIN